MTVYSLLKDLKFVILAFNKTVLMIFTKYSFECLLRKNKLYIGKITSLLT